MASPKCRLSEFTQIARTRFVCVAMVPLKYAPSLIPTHRRTAWLVMAGPDLEASWNLRAARLGTWRRNSRWTSASSVAHSQAPPGIVAVNFRRISAAIAALK